MLSCPSPSPTRFQTAADAASQEECMEEHREEHSAAHTALALDLGIGGGDLPLNLRHHPQRGFLHTSTTSTRTAPFQRRGRGTYGLRKLRRVMKWHHHGRGDLASRADLELLLRREETRIGSCGASVMSPTKAEGAEMRTNSKPCNQILDLAYPQTQIGPRERCARGFSKEKPRDENHERRKSRATWSPTTRSTCHIWQMRPFARAKRHALADYLESDESTTSRY